MPDNKAKLQIDVRDSFTRRVKAFFYGFLGGVTLAVILYFWLFAGSSDTVYQLVRAINGEKAIKRDTVIKEYLLPPIVIVTPEERRKEPQELIVVRDSAIYVPDVGDIDESQEIDSLRKGEEVTIGYLVRQWFAYRDALRKTDAQITIEAMREDLESGVQVYSTIDMIRWKILSDSIVFTKPYQFEIVNTTAIIPEQKSFFDKFINTEVIYFSAGFTAAALIWQLFFVNSIQL